MKNKFLALAAFSTAILGGAILSAPANAQIAQGTETETINVDVTVPEILFLRTITTATVPILPADLVGGAGAALLTANGSTPAAYTGSDQSIGNTLSTTSPFTLAAAPVTKTISNAYIVWSNSPTGNYSVGITPAGFAGITVAVNPASVGVKPALGLVHATGSNIDLDVTLADTQAGTYSGTLVVDAFRP
ncbi:hypothetical protein [Nostoc sp. C110]|uniref:hypothetical protein n=1 Tax=Nostoc sp. C110 TaxID=3349876 RepID=UPI00370DB388